MARNIYCEAMLSELSSNMVRREIYGTDKLAKEVAFKMSLEI